jgi:alcohol dehydrogenase class IV
VHFVHDWLPQRVVFATAGAAGAVAEEVRRLGASRVMAIASDAGRAAPVLEGVPVEVLHTEVVMHVPVEVAERARAVAAEHDVEALVCVGGGSTTGLAKAVALTTGLPIVAVPTTYAGSEATDVWGLTDDDR